MAFFFEVEHVSPEEVLDEVRYNVTFKRLSKHPDLIEKHQWVKIAYGNTFAFAGVKSCGDKLEFFVDVSEDCIIDDFVQMIVDGIRDYSNDEGIESAISVSPSDSRTPLRQ